MNQIDKESLTLYLFKDEKNDRREISIKELDDIIISKFKFLTVDTAKKIARYINCGQQARKIRKIIAKIKEEIMGNDYDCFSDREELINKLRK